MGERKVLNKRYPPDFDPANFRRRRQHPKNQQMKVRMMLPMSIRCRTCGNYIYKGTKFNSHKEDVVGEKYLGRIQIFRFYFKCPKCSAEITFKTDPQNSDYFVESGASRNFEPWRVTEEEKKKRNNAEEMGDDFMKSLENRTLESKVREIDITAALDELKSMNSRRATVSVDAMLGALNQRANEQIKKERELDAEAIIISVFRGQRATTVVRSIDDEDLDYNEGTSTGLSKVPDEQPFYPDGCFGKNH